MKGFGEKCPECGQSMRIERRLKYAPNKQSAVLGCFHCNIYWRVELEFKATRFYLSSKSKIKDLNINSRRQNFNLPIYGREVADGLFGLGELCLECGSNMRVRTSRKLCSETKQLYLVCNKVSCDAKQSVRLVFYKG